MKVLAAKLPFFREGLFAGVFLHRQVQQPENLIAGRHAVHGYMEKAAQLPHGKEKVRRQQNNQQAAKQVHLSGGKLGGGQNHPQGRPAADARQKLLLMQLALEQAGPLLKVYASPASRSRLAPAMLQTVEQLQSAGMEVSGLEDFARTLPQGSLRSKLLDTAAVYAEYQGLLQRRFSDPLEDLPKAARLAAEHRLFEGDGST